MPPSQLMSHCAVDRRTGLQLAGVIPAVVLGEAAIMPAPPASAAPSAAVRPDFGLAAFLSANSRSNTANAPQAPLDRWR